MKAVLTVFRKELKDTLRDRRTIITMVIIPLLLFPLLISISSRFMISRAKKAQEKVLVVGLVMKENAPDFREMLLEREDVRIVEGLSTEEGQTLVKADSLDAFLSFERKFDSHVADLRPGRITFYFKGTEDREIEKRRVGDLIEVYEGRLRESRFKNLDLDIAIIETVDVTEMNLATSKEKVADVIGGFLPYLFILFCFMGSMYTAIDLAAGEKERGTLETLLTSPVSRFHILLGKFGVVVLTGICTAAISILGLYFGMRQVKEIPAELYTTLLTILEWDSIGLLLTLLLPLTVFFAGILLSLSAFAKSFKEAQSTVSPMMFVVIIPAFIGLMPGMKLTATTALIPILNVSLATKAIIADTVTPGPLALVYLSLTVFALLSLLVCSRVFTRESTIFR